MMKKFILVLAIVTLFTGCAQSNEKRSYLALTDDFLEADEIAVSLEKGDGYSLMKINCYTCHNPNTESHDELLAPPFKAVKMHYKRVHDTKEKFVEAVVSYVKNPNEENALMSGAIRRFDVMPKLELPNGDLENIAAYFYDNDVEEPVWMEGHMKGMKAGTGGKGKKGHGNRKNNH